MVAIFKGKKKEMTAKKQQIILAAKEADRVEYYTLNGLEIAALYKNDTKLISVVQRFWDFI